jgi:hypothetical protein
MTRQPSRFDFVVIPQQLAGVEGLESIPFLVDTVICLRDVGLFDDPGIRQILSSTFFKAFEILGDLRVVLDLFMTGQSWLVPGRGGQFMVSPFANASNLIDEEDLMALRYARTLGLSPMSKYYSIEQAVVYGRRFGVSLRGEATLAQCAKKLGLSRERVRQIFDRLPTRFSRRQWPMSDWASQIQASLLAGYQPDAKRPTVGSRLSNSPKREHAENYLSMYGLASTSYRQNNDLEGRLSQHQLTLSKIRLECFRASESLGFVHESTALDHLCEVFAPVERELLAEALRATQRFELPDGYKYFESSAQSSYFFGAAARVLGLVGPISTDELYQAAERHARYRLPQSVFPSRNVVRALLLQDSRFVVDDDSVDIVVAPELNLDGLVGWMFRTIGEVPGRVMYRAELLQKARCAGHNVSSIQVFMIRHEFFKMCGQNCVTIVGVFPTEREISEAHLRGSLRRVSTELTWSSRGENFVLDLVAGTDLCDAGLLTLDRSLVGMFSGRRLRIMVSRSQHGFVGWSKGTTTGWATAMREAGVVPGDRAEIILDSASNTARVKKVS